MRRWLEKRLEQAERHAELNRQTTVERYKLNAEYEHARSRVIFWIVRGLKLMDCDKKWFNGELQKAFDAMEAAEAKLKDLDRRQLASLYGEE